VIGAALAGLAAAVLSACAPMCSDRPAPITPCVGAVVIVHGDDPIGCDVRPPQTITVTGVTRAKCDDLGGSFTEPDECDRVDY